MLTRDVKLVVQTVNATQGTKISEKLLNNRLTAVLETLDINKCASDYEVHVWFCLGDTVILNFLPIAFFWMQKMIRLVLKLNQF